MSRICDLPEGILNEILIRLPVKSIGKSRCVSLHWNSLLTSPRFINTHLARSHQQKNLLVLCNYKCLISFNLRSDGVAFENRDSVPTLDRRFMLIGHFNGLVLIGTKTGGRLSMNPDYLLMNPITLQHSRLPQPPFISFSPFQCLGSIYGLGYDSSSDDYKLVHLVVVVCNTDNTDVDNNRGSGSGHIFAHIYSLRNKLWRRVNIDHRLFCSSDDGAGVLFNGALHWLSYYPDHAIHAVDLATEKCYEIPSLPSRDGQYVDSLIITKGGSGSCLGIASWLEAEARIDIWAMNKYGMAESWTKKFYLDEKRPWFWRDALVIQHYRDALDIQHHHYKLTCCPYNDEKSFDLTLDTRERRSSDGALLVQNVYSIDGLMFTESLVSPLNTWSL